MALARATMGTARYQESRMDAEPGDDLIVDSDDGGHAERVGTILKVNGSDGHPQFLVHWVSGDYDSLVSPWPGVHVRHRVRAG
jgi:Domain of unknown function (DUF1918)